MPNSLTREHSHTAHSSRSHQHEPRHQASTKSIRKLGSELGDLTNAVLTTEETFHDAKNSLQWPSKDLPEEIKAPVGDQGSLLADHLKAYTQLVGNSREFAGSIGAIVDDFSDDLKGYLESPEQDAPVDSKISSMEVAIQKVDQTIEKGSTLTESFAELQKNLQEFKTGFRAGGKVDGYPNQVAVLDQEINSLRSHISQLEHELEDERSKGCGPWPFSGVHWGKTAKEIELEKEIKESQDNLAEKQTQVKVCREVIEQVTTWEQKITTATKQYDDVVVRMHDLTAIPDLVREDFKNLLSILNEKPFIQQTLTTQIERLIPIYLLLSNSLVSYQNTVVKK